MDVDIARQETTSSALTLRLLMPDDAPDLCRWYKRNREFHSYWSIEPIELVFEESNLAYLLERYKEAASLGLSFAFGVFDDTPQKSLVGTVSLSSVKKGVLKSAKVGYALDKFACGKGIASTALRQVQKFAYYGLGIERLEAITLPGNLPSRRVLEKNHFSMIGIVDNGIKIRGEHRKYLLYSCSRYYYEAFGKEGFATVESSLAAA